MKQKEVVVISLVVLVVLLLAGLFLENGVYQSPFLRTSNEKCVYGFVEDGKLNLDDGTYSLSRTDSESLDNYELVQACKGFFGRFNVEPITATVKEPKLTTQRQLPEVGHVAGDMDCDGDVDFEDINPFVIALGNEAGYNQQFPNCFWIHGDCNNDWDVNFDDINPFVQRIGFSFCMGSTPPVAEIVASSLDIEVGESVTFHSFDSEDSDPNGFITGVKWMIEDQTYDLEVISHTFNNAGQIPITLQVGDDCGNQDVEVITIDVEDGNNCNNPLNNPVAKIIASSTNVEVGESVTFDGTTSTGPNPIMSYEWTIEGQTYTTEIVNHQFDNAGQIPVTLKVTDGCGNEDTDVITVNVQDGSSCIYQWTNPEAIATASAFRVAPGGSIDFDGVQSTSQNPIASYEWLIDHQIYPGQTRTHTFNQLGAHQVTLIVTDVCGNKDIHTQYIGVTEDYNEGDELVADFKIKKLVGLEPDGTEIWQEIDYDNEAIEVGERFLVDATGAHGLFGTSYVSNDVPVKKVSKDASGHYQVFLQVWTPDWMHSEQLTKNLYVSGYEFTDEMGQSPVTFHPSHSVVFGNELWSLSTYATAVGAATINDPKNLPTLAIFGSPDFSEVKDFAGGQFGTKKYLYIPIPNYNDPEDGRLDVYRASQSNFEKIDSLSMLPSEFDGRGANLVEASGKYLYIGTYDRTDETSRLLIYDMSGTIPVQLSSLDVGTIGSLELFNENVIVASSTSDVNIIDVRNPASPVVVDTIQSDKLIFDNSNSNENVVVLRVSGGGLVIPIDAPESGPIAIGKPFFISNSPVVFDLNEDTLFIREDYSVRLYDFKNLDDIYLKAIVSTEAQGRFSTILMDDVLCNGEPVLMAGTNGLGYNSICKADVFN